MIVVDSNGQSEIVGAFLTSTETMVQVFKSHNLNLSQTNVIISDNALESLTELAYSSYSQQ